MFLNSGFHIWNVTQLCVEGWGFLSLSQYYKTLRKRKKVITKQENDSLFCENAPCSHLQVYYHAQLLALSNW